MKPIVIFRHSPGEGPGYFAEFLDERRIPWRLVKIDAGESPPALDDCAGLCFMGGPMSVNDDLDWLPAIFALIRQAVATQVPVIGHCLGGQLLAKALGATVSRNPVKEIGWGRVTASGPLAEDWLSDLTAFEAFHWHGETFELPAGAHRLLQSRHCANQAYVIGPHLGMQCHVEMTEAMIRLWCRQWSADCVAASDSVQTPEQMQVDIEARLARMRVAADRLYTRWLAGVRN